MQRQIYEVTRDRFSLKDKNVYILQGTWPEDYEAEAWLDSRRLKTEMTDQERVSALERFKDRDLVGGCRKQITVYLPEDLAGYRKLTVYASADGKKEAVVYSGCKQAQAKTEQNSVLSGRCDWSLMRRNVVGSEDGLRTVLRYAFG